MRRFLQASATSSTGMRASSPNTAGARFVPVAAAACEAAITVDGGLWAEFTGLTFAAAEPEELPAGGAATAGGAAAGAT